MINQLLHLKGDGSFDEAGLIIEDMEAVAGDLIIFTGSKFNCRLTTLEGGGAGLTNRNMSSLTGVTKGVVSGVASMAASGGDSRQLATFALLIVSVLLATYAKYNEY